MARNSELRLRRDAALRERYKQYRSKNPKYSVDALLKDVAAEFYLCPVTAAKILWSQQVAGIPHATTISRREKAPEIVH